ncbi:periplasmic heavy metal sensor [uncultured Desulfosarcina sp.]|uniref:Spy/CpxP family protein refolding chaperone n=1 Tax=uncultured Desulfosarcina sp. TaxID=218289 RepID=UPI0029C645E9|nr:periplasmic heavy metal sensor [uncultured Desulfosarcina sp.]
MKTSKTKAVIAGLAAVAVITMGGTAIAGKGYRQDGQRSGEYGQQYRDGSCRYADRNPNLTPEQREQLDAERKAFFEGTHKDRQDLRAKRLALRSEIAKSELDINAAKGLQKEISRMQADLDMKRLDHIVNVRKIDPDAGRGFFGKGRGNGHHGSGHHSGKGRGMGMGNGPEDCPYNQVDK